MVRLDRGYIYSHSLNNEYVHQYVHNSSLSSGYIHSYSLQHDPEIHLSALEQEDDAIRFYGLGIDKNKTVGLCRCGKRNEILIRYKGYQWTTCKNCGKRITQIEDAPRPARKAAVDTDIQWKAESRAIELERIRTRVRFAIIVGTGILLAIGGLILL